MVKNKKSILSKHPPLTKKDIEKRKIESKKAKEKYAIDVAEVEKSLTEFLEIKDPILYNGKAIAFVRRPSMKELKELIPEELSEYVDNPENVPPEITKKYEGFFYEKMAELIAVPKKTAKEWEKTANPWFIRMFWQHIADVAKLMEGQIEGF